jgi:DNA repair protein REV1
MEKLGSTALKDLASKSRAVLSEALGKKTGEKLYNAIRGIDDTQLTSDKQRKSVSAEVNVRTRDGGSTFWLTATFPTVWHSI